MAAVASMPVPNAVTSSGKRRRDIAVAIEDTTTSSKIAKLETSSPPEPIVTVRNSTSAKRPQLKYDPSVPMRKQQTSKWRADQRRKRNRESAAACRKRQRDRISELEVEVSEWKVKFNNALLQLQNIEGEEAAMKLKSMLEEKYIVPPPKNPEMVGSSGNSRCKTPPNTSDVVATSSMQRITTTVQQGNSNIVSPNDQRPKFIPPLISSSDEVLLDELHFPVLEESIIKATDLNLLGGVSSAASDSLMSRVENRQHLNEKITRPAKSSLLKTPVTTPRFDRCILEYHFGYHHYYLTQWAQLPPVAHLQNAVFVSVFVNGRSPKKKNDLLVFLRL